MKKSRFSDNQIVNILKQAEQGVPIAELCREHNIGQSTFYNWRSKYGGMDASLIARLKELEVENARLKKRMPCQKSGSAAWAQSVGLSLY
jgi:putative transposase